MILHGLKEDSFNVPFIAHISSFGNAHSDIILSYAYHNTFDVVIRLNILFIVGTPDQLPDFEHGYTTLAFKWICRSKHDTRTSDMISPSSF